MSDQIKDKLEQSAPPTDFKRNIPTEGKFDNRWMQFEDVYKQYIYDCIEAVDPSYTKMSHLILNRIEEFMIEVMPKYDYNPERERFRTFLHRLVNATVSYLKSGKGCVDEWQAEFKKVNNGADNDELEAMLDSFALDDTFSSNNLTDEEILAFKAELGKRNIDAIIALGTENVNKEYKRVVEQYRLSRALISLKKLLTGFDPKDAA